MILAQLAHFASHTVNSLALFQEETVSFSPMGLWNHMGWLARCVAILLFIESIWSLAVGRISVAKATQDHQAVTQQAQEIASRARRAFNVD